jgi:hypothetical protein
MGLNDNHRRLAWVPQGCTLPRFKRPFRAAEFDRLFTDAVRDVERVGPTRLRLELEASPGVAGRAAKLATAETECCSFFTFTLTATGGRLVLEVTVPPPQAGVLDGLAGRAAAAAGLGG